MATIAERLKEIMEIQNLRQVDLVRLAEPVGETNGLHISKSHISQYVSGRTQPRRDILKVLAEALGVSQLWLQGEDVPMKSAENRQESPQIPERRDMWDQNGVRHFTKSTKLDNVLYDVRGPVVDEAARMEEAGMKILKLNIGNPAPFGFRTPDEVISDMRQQLTECEGYSDSRGLFSARKKSPGIRIALTFGQLLTHIADHFVRSTKTKRCRIADIQLQDLHTSLFHAGCLIHNRPPHIIQYIIQLCGFCEMPDTILVPHITAFWYLW